MQGTTICIKKGAVNAPFLCTKLEDALFKDNLEAKTQTYRAMIGAENIVFDPCILDIVF